MKYYLILFILVSSFCNAGDYSYYVKIGAGYKFNEPSTLATYVDGVRYTDGVDFGGPITSRIEIGVETGNVSFGISHHSQWLEGWPINDKDEYYKTEVFIDYKFTFGGN